MEERKSLEDFERIKQELREKHRPEHVMRPIRVTIQGSETREYDSIVDCSRVLKLDESTIRAALRAGGAFGDFYFEEF